MSGTRLHAVASLEELSHGRARGVWIGNLLISLYRDGDRVAALSARCPHAAGSMSHGWVEDGEAVCPLHRWRFRLTDGRCTSVRDESIRTYPCVVRDGMVYVEA